MNPTRRTDLTAREVEGQVLILDRQREQVHQLNETASFIWECCDGSSTIGDIARRVAERFGTESAAIEPEIGEAISKLRELGLLQTGT
jgi:hypothetical protein